MFTARTACLLSLVALATALVAPACGGSESGPGGVGPGGALVGGHCGSDRDCTSRCVRKDAYPGGICTVSCRDDRDCPVGTACIDDEGGMCAIACVAHADCAPFGPEYRCDDRGRKGASGDAFVCRKD